MASAKPASVDEYLARQPADRRDVLSALRQVIGRNLPRGYREAYNWGMVTYEVPLERFPDTYNGQPLAYVALAAQNNYYALYLTSAYQDADLRSALAEAFAKAGKKLDMGKSCLRFRTLADLPLDAIGAFVASTPVDAFLARYEAARGKTAQPKRKTRATGKAKGAAKKKRAKPKPRPKRARR